MDKPDNRETPQPLPPCAAEYIAQVVRKVRYRKKVRRDIESELTAHFEDELQTCATADERDAKAHKLIEEFGDPKLLAILCRRAKKRCRPLWKKTLVRGCQLLGVVLIFCFYAVICALPLYFGKPTIKMNYVQWLNDTVRANRQESDNAWPYYEKAAKLNVPMPEWLRLAPGKSLKDFNDAAIQQLSHLLVQNAQSFDLVREGTRRPSCWRHYAVKPMAGASDPCYPVEIVGGLMEDPEFLMMDWYSVAWALQWQVCYEAFRGEMDAALDDCQTLAQFGDHLLGHGLDGEQLTAELIERLASDSVLQLLDQPNVDLALLVRAQQWWQRHLDQHPVGLDLTAEKGMQQYQVQWSFTDDGKGNGHALIGGIAYWSSGFDDVWKILTLRPPTRREVVAAVDEYYSRLNQLIARTPWESQRQGINSQNWCGSVRRTLLLSFANDGDYGLVELDWQRRTHAIGVLVALAVKRYRIERGQYPDHLEQLVEAGYLRELPRDPYSPGPLSYRKTGDDFLLYSWGKNFKDDGGVQSLNSSGKQTPWWQGEDWVFWPVPRSSNR